MEHLKVSLIQSDLVWHNAAANLDAFANKIAQVDEPTDLIILPEMFTTGFSMDAASLAEAMDGPSINWMRQQAAKMQAVIMGSIIINDNGQYFNRLIWMRPDGTYEKYDKRHLFAMAEEHKYYTSGKQVLIVNYKGWNICPMICYDLRFPVWSRNIDLKYDVLIYIASWPNKRAYHWNALLQARAIENQSYVIGVNRVGTDGNGHEYNGDSCIIDSGWDQTIFHCEKEDCVHTATLSKGHLEKVREKLPFSKDADDFKVII